MEERSQARNMGWRWKAFLFHTFKCSWRRNNVGCINILYRYTLAFWSMECIWWKMCQHSTAHTHAETHINTPTHTKRKCHFVGLLRNVPKECGMDSEWLVRWTTKAMDLFGARGFHRRANDLSALNQIALISISTHWLGECTVLGARSECSGFDAVVFDHG